MPPVHISSQNLRERSLQVSAPRVPAGGVHGGKKKRIRSLHVLGHRAGELEHRAAAEHALDLADVAALRQALLLDVGPQRLRHRGARRLARNAGDLRQGRGLRHRLKEALASFFHCGGALLTGRSLGLRLRGALPALAARVADLLGLLLLPFFFFFFAFFFFVFLAFFAFFALGFLAFFAFAFLAAVSCVRASDFLIAFFTTTVVSSTTGS